MTQDEKLEFAELIRRMIEKLGITADEIFPQQKPGLTQPIGFEVKELPSVSLPYARYKGEIIGVIFQVGGKHFIFSHKDRYTNFSPNEVIKRLDMLDAIGEQRWRIPSVSEFREVQKLHALFNELSSKIGGSKLDANEYMDTNTALNKRVPHVRLTLWAPWLD